MSSDLDRFAVFIKWVPITNWIWGSYQSTIAHTNTGRTFAPDMEALHSPQAKPTEFYNGTLFGSNVPSKNITNKLVMNKLNFLAKETQLMSRMRDSFHGGEI